MTGAFGVATDQGLRVPCGSHISGESGHRGLAWRLLRHVEDCSCCRCWLQKNGGELLNVMRSWRRPRLV